MIPNKETSVIAAIGTLNNLGQANAHLDSDVSEDLKIDFSSNGVQRCSTALEKVPEMPKVKPWPSMKISATDTFYFKIGPTGGERGYSPITGNS